MEMKLKTMEMLRTKNKLHSKNIVYKAEPDVVEWLNKVFETKSPDLVDEDDEDSFWTADGVVDEVESWFKKAWKRAISSGEKLNAIILCLNQ